MNSIRGSVIGITASACNKSQKVLSAVVNSIVYSLLIQFFTCPENVKIQQRPSLVQQTLLHQQEIPQVGYFCGWEVNTGPLFCKFISQVSLACPGNHGSPG